ncbi:MAG: hypothetical protein IPN86_13780 [Saprospiraceae bacterium]|nr:hypothetical protein [Saprospiraceae bacterium]
MKSHVDQKLIDKIFDAQDENGLWKVLSDTDKYYPDYLHYVPNFKASLWTLILLADVEIDRNEPRVKKALEAVKDQFYDHKYGIYTLREDHFPIPCLNGNIIYIDSYFNKTPDNRSMQALAFFHKYQRFDDGKYEEPKNQFCANTSCYGKHSCYWGIVKLLKGISFIPQAYRTKEILELKDKCVNFVLKHQVCYSSHYPDKIMIDKMDHLTFPNMYKSDFLEILWVLKRENIKSDELTKAIRLLKTKQLDNGAWPLERKIHNMVASIGETNGPNPYVTKRAEEVLNYYLSSN